MQNLIFAVHIKPDGLLGNVFLPFFIVKKNEKYYEKNKLILVSDIKNSNYSFSDWMTIIIKKSHLLRYAELNKRFNKRHLRTTFSEFLESTDEKNSHFIRSFIEKKNIEIAQIIKNNEPFLFILKDRDKHVYNENIIHISHEPAEVEMEFEKKSETLHYRLKVIQNKQLVDLTHNSLLLLSNISPSIVYKNKLFWFENDKFNGNKLKPFLSKTEVVIPSKLESVFFEKFIKPSVRNFNCIVKGFKLYEIELKPKAELRIEKTIFGDFIFTPFFIYKTYKIQFLSKQKSFVTVIEKNGNYGLESIDRDYNSENFFLDELHSLGLKKENNAYILDIFSKNKYNFIEQIRELIPKLQQTGFKIINNLFANEVSYNTPELSYTSSRKQDWFDLYITVRFGKFEIEFIELKNHILNHIEEFELPDGTIAIIPEAWFSKLYSFAKRTKGENQTSILKTHVKIFDDNSIILPDEAIEKSIDEFEIKKKVKLPKKSIAKLRGYQKTGYQWMYQLTQHQFGVCLADDMGLGKTLQVITLLQKYFENHTVPTVQPDSTLNKAQSTPAKIQLSLFDILPEDKKSITSSEKGNEPSYKSVLLVVPKSLIYNWVIELEKFAPELSYSIYHSIDRQQNLKDTLHKKNIIITTYGVVRKDIELLKNEQFSYVILDESQVIKNPDSKTYQAAVLLESQYRISMTGTPIENNLTDVWSQMNFLNHGILGNLSYFEKAFRNQIQNNPDALELEELRSIIDPFILRRLKKDVAKELPEKIEQTVFCEMHTEQFEWYEKEKSAIRNELLSKNIKKNYIDVLAVLNRLRQIAIHPNLLDNGNKMTSGKFETIVQYIESIIEQGDKFLIFSSFVKHLNLFKKYFEEHQISYSMLTGKDQHRQKIVEEFETNENIKPFLISIKAGGVGLNLTSANYVFIIDPWWNPFIEKQAIDRTHRIGQDKNVMVYRFISKNSIEEKILDLQRVKLKMSDDLLDSEFTKNLKLADILKLI
jgi:SNF2 family DNA or RNA helicase